MGYTVYRRVFDEICEPLGVEISVKPRATAPWVSNFRPLKSPMRSRLDLSLLRLQLLVVMDVFTV